MTTKKINTLSNEKLVKKFNEFLFSLQKQNQTEIINELEARKVSAFEAFPRLRQALLKQEDTCGVFIENLKNSNIRKAKDTLKQIFNKTLQKDISYFALEALGLLDWKNQKELNHGEFSEFLYYIIREPYYDVYRFIARVIAFWHFREEFKFDVFALGAQFETNESELIEHMLVKILAYSVEDNNYCFIDYEAAHLIGKFKIKKAESLLIKAMKKIDYKEDQVYIKSEDRYHWLRLDAAAALICLETSTAKENISKLVESEPANDVLNLSLRMMY
ncbi:MAG: hypothetical protein ACTSQN_12670 [Candidatus Heimdallarchaeota archaeon]